MTTGLSGIPETLLIPLWARAAETRAAAPIVRDTRAADIMARIDYDFARFDRAWLTQVGVAVRTKILDRATRAYLDRVPGATVVSLGAGLDTRHARLAPRVTRWYDLDLPEVIALRRRFFSDTDRYRMIPASMFATTWMDRVAAEGTPVLLIAEGVLPYFAETDLKPLLATLAERFRGGEMLLQTLPPALVGRGRYHDSVRRLDGRPDFKWGVTDVQTLAGWHSGLSVAEHWNYFDYHKDRWRWYGRLMTVPALRRRMSRRIVRLRFGEA
ncbi:class I SAM-dependent methyltransferase [Roseospira visakhapatnamensis]|uniref:O-methyltransferase involved in polyketide biosynthesis n=1 Tax=Roseospira visakhapatnamensis TaxID=390880 RepID=A0A7W6RB06_9PROT|nr:class I SAM-dependent methyltransferase [Roseospira visakhapatnamensis]MBB4264553.1 O-methyltransferase involved in polyketide biosynthesis [Roseospira visakhapatnamensis]